MHCDEVIRELAVPTDDRDSAALAEHLANCPSVRRLGQAGRSIRSSLGRDATYGTFGPGLGHGMGSHRFIARFLDAGRV